jgi:hypothetical protein
MLLQNPLSHLSDFLERHSSLLKGAAVGGVIATSISQFAPNSTAFATEARPELIGHVVEHMIVHGSISNEALGIDEAAVDDVQLERMVAARRIRADLLGETDPMIDKISKPNFKGMFGDALFDRKEMLELISNKRALLENAARELNILEEKIFHISDVEDKDTILSTVMMFNDNLAGTEFEISPELLGSLHNERLATHLSSKP